ncbi:MAG TPA: Ig-like domain-containing protein, partial [Dermatophilaceae bacterium]
MSLRFQRRHGFAAALLALSVLLTACQGLSVGSANGSPKSGSDQTSPTTTPTPETTPAVLEVSPADLAIDVLPNAPITVKASSGTLGAVTLVDAKGTVVPGAADPLGTWTTTDLLHPATAYTFTIAATGPDGTVTSTSSTFTTLKPKVTATYGLIPNGGVVGVGMPVIVQFGSGVITKAQRA